MKTSDFDFDLPLALIAQEPIEPRDQSRLMVVRRASGRLEHRRFADLPELLAPGDLIARNNTKVVPARLIGRRERTGGNWEGLFLRIADDGRDWETLSKTRGRLQAGETVVVGGGLRLVLVERLDSGGWRVRPESDERAETLLERFGRVPLPPYIRKGIATPADLSRYQTVYAGPAGSVAAPTAGLHFTPELLERLEARGIASAEVTLHVGLGTFRPIEAEEIEDHALHAETAEVSEATARRLNEWRERGGRIVAVGTTSARTLETSAASGRFEPFRGETALYIKPGREFRGLDALITNFHLPKSSLIVLVSALAGVDLVRDAYATAIREGYRFYSYGDAMLILPD